MHERGTWRLGVTAALFVVIPASAWCAAALPTGAQDLSAVWWTNSYNPRIRPVEGGDLPFTPQGAELYRKNMEELRAGTREDIARAWCAHDGLPRAWQAPYPFQIIQTPGQTSIVYEINQSFRTIPMDQALPKDEDILPWFYGNSAGKWEGATLVVESKGFKTTTFLDATGVPVSDGLHLIERIRKLNDNQLEVMVTVEDPMIFTRAWNARFLFQRRPDVQLETYVCGDEHRDLSSVQGANQWR